MKNKSLFDSFNNALNGIIETLKNERNFKIHFFIGFMVLLVVLFIDIDSKEFLIVLFSIVFVLVCELLNTSVEAIVDLYCGEKYNEKAKIAKDAAAGGVFISAMYSFIVGYIIIFRKLIEIDYRSIVMERIKQTPIYITLICVLIVVMLTVAAKAVSGQKNLLKGGMPSAHSGIAFCAATCILFLTTSMVAIILAYFLAALVAQSRIEGKIHSLLQALLGSLLGILVTVFIFQLM